MIKSWIFAGLLSIVAGIFRSFAGDTGVLAIARSSNMDIDSIAFYHGSWYANSLITLITGIVFLYIGFKPRQFASSQIAILMSGIMIFTILLVIVVYSSFGWSAPFYIPVVLLSVNSVFGLYGVKALAQLEQR